MKTTDYECSFSLVYLHHNADALMASNAGERGVEVRLQITTHGVKVCETAATCSDLYQHLSLVRNRHLTLICVKNQMEVSLPLSQWRQSVLKLPP
jgi:hypothetical protein